MLKINIKNERIKRKFFRRLKEADGCCDSTVNNIEKAILLYEDFTKQTDFASFNPDQAIEFKKWLKKREFRGRVISLVTYYIYLRHIRKFFNWLSGEAGYKSKITSDAVAYLKITDREEKMATQYIPRNYPPLEYVVKLANSIKVNSEIDLRDRALISFALLTGMRDKAIITLPLGCFDAEKLNIKQDPKQGVQTKFFKYIPSIIFKFNEKLLEYILEWGKHLKTKNFGAQDPLFPRSKLEQGKDGITFETASEVEPIFWQGTGGIRGIFKKRSKEMGLPYYPPHTFRHLAVDLAIKGCKTMEQLKAICQNFGHEHIATTLSSYANYVPDRFSKILNSIDFSEKPAKTKNDKLEKIKEILFD